MRFPYRQRWLLRRMNRSLCRSDPHLTAMLAIFARLAAGEAITSQEQATAPGARAWRGLAWLGRATVHVAAAVSACAGRMLRCVGGWCAAALRRLSRLARTALGISSPARPPLRRNGPGLPAS